MLKDLSRRTSLIALLGAFAIIWGVVCLVYSKFPEPIATATISSSKNTSIEFKSNISTNLYADLRGGMCTNNPALQSSLFSLPQTARFQVLHKKTGEIIKESRDTLLGICYGHGISFNTAIDETYRLSVEVSPLLVGQQITIAEHPIERKGWDVWNRIINYGVVPILLCLLCISGGRDIIRSHTR